jgi:predicted chitinase
MREAQQREQQVLALEARARKEMELAQKGAEAARARTLSQTQSASVPMIARVFSKEVWQQKPRPATGATMAPRREAKVRG